MIDIDLIIAYENGALDEVDTLTLFTALVRSGQAWLLQGHYGRTAQALIDGGFIELDSGGAQ